MYGITDKDRPWEVLISIHRNRWQEDLSNCRIPTPWNLASVPGDAHEEQAARFEVIFKALFQGEKQETFSGLARIALIAEIDRARKLTETSIEDLARASAISGFLLSREISPDYGGQLLPPTHVRQLADTLDGFAAEQSTTGSPRQHAVEIGNHTDLLRRAVEISLEPHML